MRRGLIWAPPKETQPRESLHKSGLHDPARTGGQGLCRLRGFEVRSFVEHRLIFDAGLLWTNSSTIAKPSLRACLRKASTWDAIVPCFSCPGLETRAYKATFISIYSFVVHLRPALVGRTRQSAEDFQQQLLLIGSSRHPARVRSRTHGYDPIGLVPREEARPSALQKSAPRRIARDGRQTLGQKLATQSLVDLPRRIGTSGTWILPWRRPR